MNRTGRTLSLGCLLLFLPLFAFAGGNSLLIPASGSCALNASPEEMPDALASCQEMARAGNMQAAFELGEYYYDCLLYTSIRPTAVIDTAHSHSAARNSTSITGHSARPRA